MNNMNLKGYYGKNLNIDRALPCGITKPENSRTNKIAKLPAVIEATSVWKTDARNRNIDNEVKCAEKSRMNWRKNL